MGFTNLKGLEAQPKKEMTEKLEKIMLLKRLLPKIPLPAAHNGIDLKINGEFDRKKISKLLKISGVGVKVDEPAVITHIKLKGKHIEIHLNGGGYGTFSDMLGSALLGTKIFRGDEGGTLAAGSRINLRFDRRIEPEDITPEKLAGWLDILLDASGLLPKAAEPDETIDQPRRPQPLPKAGKFDVEGQARVAPTAYTSAVRRGLRRSSERNSCSGASDAVGEGLFSAVALEMDPGTRIFTTLPVVPVPEMPSQE